MPLRLYNTLTRSVEPLRPIDASHVTFYTCGPTVYDDAHIGNFRSFLAADVLRRWLESPLCEVTSPTGAPAPAPPRAPPAMKTPTAATIPTTPEGAKPGEAPRPVPANPPLEPKKTGRPPP